LAAVGELHTVTLAAAVDLDDHLGRQGVHDRHAHAVQAAGHLVALAVELAAAVELGQRDLDARHLLGLVHVRGDATAVVDDATAAVGEEGHVDAGGVPGHRLVDGVVDDLPHAVVQPVRTRRPDVHAGALADRLEALEDPHVVRAVL